MKKRRDILNIAPLILGESQNIRFDI
ncbi:protein of unknown function [Methylocella tundrae]|uniref:Uncharacterized protein n=1 Tax=Methylocella tundrae TaxID=227605 RepID=A0A4U8Z2A0_METTU|nr:protein of unknown function [Methylocella tundrae]